MMVCQTLGGLLLGLWGDCWSTKKQWGVLFVQHSWANQSLSSREVVQRSQSAGIELLLSAPWMHVSSIIPHLGAGRIRFLKLVTTEFRHFLYHFQFVSIPQLSGKHPICDNMGLLLHLSSLVQDNLHEYFHLPILYHGIQATATNRSKWKRQTFSDGFRRNRNWGGAMNSIILLNSHFTINNLFSSLQTKSHSGQPRILPSDESSRFVKNLYAALYCLIQLFIHFHQV